MTIKEAQEQVDICLLCKAEGIKIFKIIMNA